MAVTFAAGYVSFLVNLLLLLSLAESVPLMNIARNVHSDLVLVSRQQPARFPRRINQGTYNPKDVPVGQALDLFYRFGFFSLSVRVVPRDDAGSWLIREPTTRIFDEASSASNQVAEAENVFDSDFQVFMCDDEAELMEAYFKQFTADGIEEPYKLFTGSWHSTTKAKYFGLDKSVFDGDSSFVLVRLQKRRAVVSAPREPVLRSDVAKAARSLDALDFTRRYGSHYIDQVIIGESIYQVYAVERPQYEATLRALSGRHTLSSSEFRAVQKSALAPWAVRQVGSPQVASGSQKVQQLLEGSQALRRSQPGAGPFSQTAQPDLLNLVEAPEVMAQLEEAARDAEAVIGLHFSSLRRFVPDGKARQDYDSLVGTSSLLWEANL